MLYENNNVLHYKGGCGTEGDEHSPNEKILKECDDFLRLRKQQGLDSEKQSDESRLRLYFAIIHDNPQYKKNDEVYNVCGNCMQVLYGSNEIKN